MYNGIWCASICIFQVLRVRMSSVVQDAAFPEAGCQHVPTLALAPLQLYKRLGNLAYVCTALHQDLIIVVKLR